MVSVTKQRINTIQEVNIHKWTGSDHNLIRARISMKMEANKIGVEANKLKAKSDLYRQYQRLLDEKLQEQEGSRP